MLFYPFMFAHVAITRCIYFLFSCQYIQKWWMGHVQHCPLILEQIATLMESALIHTKRGPFGAEVSNLLNLELCFIKIRLFCNVLSAITVIHQINYLLKTEDMMRTPHLNIVFWSLAWGKDGRQKNTVSVNTHLVDTHKRPSLNSKKKVTPRRLEEQKQSPQRIFLSCQRWKLKR